MASKPKTSHGLRSPMQPFAYKGKAPSLDGSGTVVTSVTPSKMAPIRSPLDAPAKKK